MLCACFDVAFLFLNFFCSLPLQPWHITWPSCWYLCFTTFLTLVVAISFLFCSSLYHSLSLSSFGTFALIALGLIYAAAPASMQRKYFYDPIYEPSPLPCSLVHLCEYGKDQAGRGGVVRCGPRPTLIILNEIHTSPHLCDLLRTHQAGRQAARVAKAIRITHDSCRCCCCCCCPRWMATFSLSFKLIECYKFYVQNL